MGITILCKDPSYFVEQLIDKALVPLLFECQNKVENKYQFVIEMTVANENVLSHIQKNEIYHASTFFLNTERVDHLTTLTIF